jgi:hypothetical protein
MAKEQKKAGGFLARIKEHPVVTGILLVAAIIAGLDQLTGSLDALKERLCRWFNCDSTSDVSPPDPATLATLNGHIKRHFVVQGTQHSIRLLCVDSGRLDAWQLKSVTGDMFVIRRDRTPTNGDDDVEHACSPWEDCESKPWTYDFFEAKINQVREVSPCAGG